ncbi:nodulin-related protein 1 [Melia azedarach]|uniref:Nodulin-related protein 1 n=1 Tax=Melia azedarach TaxID=155640 RepID=A0ACC1XKJ6_MELAZ|nr:nodulin-related protein 1 [Melia azedarach]
MDSFFNNKPTNTNTDSKQQQHHQPSSSELLASAKYAAEAIKSTFSNESDKVDKAKAAAAAEDLLGAASRYGNLEDKSFGKYVEKAENYLHQYHSSHPATTTNTSGHSAAYGAEHSSVPSGHSGSAHGGEHSSVPSVDSDEKSGSGFGDYFKMAEGFLKKN